MLSVAAPARRSDSYQPVGLVDRFGRKITYLRLSVTDRCDLRCVYCMSETMKFLPKNELLSLDELDRLCAAFVNRGIRKIRISGGEPLVRRDIMGLFRRLSHHIDDHRLDELTLTTNGTQLGKYARELWSCGVRRINLSLDSLNADQYRRITRRGDLKDALYGLDAAQNAGLAVKINVVVLKGINDHEIEDLILFAHDRGADISLIETMPLGDVGVHRADQYVSLSAVRESLERRFTLEESSYASGGPARYVTVKETGRRLGFITPLSHNFCESCNRIRVTCTGTLYSCLGQNNAIDLRAPLRASANNQLLDHAIDAAIRDKPAGHDFSVERTAGSAGIDRHMSVTGG